MRRFGGERHPFMAGLLTERAWLEVVRGRPRRATPLFAGAADLAALSLGEDHPDHAGARRVLGLHLQGQGDHAGAEVQLRRYLSITRRTAGADHPAVAPRTSPWASYVDCAATCRPPWRSAAGRWTLSAPASIPSTRCTTRCMGWVCCAARRGN